MSTITLNGTQCPRCNQFFTDADEVVTCNACGIHYHAMCQEIGEQCVTPGCTGTPSGQPAVSGQMASMTPPPPAAPSQLVSAFANYTIQMENDRTLIVRDRTVFPPICIMTGKCDDLVKRKRTEYWAPSWSGTFFYLGLIIYAIVRLVLQKKATIEFYLDREYAKTRIMRSLGNTALFFLLFIAAHFCFAS